MEINKPIVSIIILTVNLILIFLFVIPKYKESIELQKSVAQKQAEYNVKGDYYIKLLSTVKSIDERQDLLQKIDSALPSNFSLAPIVYFIQKKSIESQLTIKSITFSGGHDTLPINFNEQVGNSSGKNGGTGIKSIILTVNLSGSYQGLKLFLYSLERSARLFQVENISFVPVGISSPQGSGTSVLDQARTYDFKLEIKTFTY